jgi:hypothetical protein
LELLNLGDGIALAFLKLATIHLLQPAVGTALGMVKNRDDITAGTRQLPFLKNPIGTDQSTKVATFTAVFIDNKPH